MPRSSPLHAFVSACRLARCKWFVVVTLCAATLSTSLALAQTAPQRLAPTGQPPAREPRVYPRHVAWWPFTTGPYYGDVELRDGDLPEDVLLTHVGSFRIGQGLAIPAELTGTLAGIAAGRSQYFLLQMRAELVNADWPERLAALGATVMGRTPVNGAVVRADRAAFERLAGSPLIWFIEPYHPAYRIHPSVGHLAQATPEEAASPQFRLQVTLWPGEPAAATADRLRQLGAPAQSVNGLPEYGETIEVIAHAALIPEIARLESVVLITEFAPALVMGERGAYFMQNTGFFTFPYWRAGIDGDGQIVAVQDTGLSVDAADHSDSASDSGWSAAGTNGGCATLSAFPGCNNPNNGTDPSAGNCHRKIVCYRWPAGVTSGADYSACDSEVSGRSTHGQVVTSVVLGNPVRGRVPAPPDPSPTDTDPADDPNSFRARMYGPGLYIDADENRLFSETADYALDGIAKGARVVFFDSATGCPEGATITVGDLVQTVSAARTEHGATVFNSSWGSDTPNTNPIYPPSGRNIDLAVNSHPIMVMVQAAGDGGESGNGGISASGATLSDNASCKNCLSVGASFNWGTVLDFSAEGPAYLGGSAVRSRIAPMILAESTDRGCRSEDSGTENQTGPATCRLQELMGTSISAPNVAGAAALIREFFAQGFYNNNPTKAISGRLVRALVFASTLPISISGKTSNPPARFNNIWGYGQLQLTRVLPLVDYPETVAGLIVHDLPPTDLDGDGTTPDGVSDLPLPGTISGGQTLTAEFAVDGVTDDLVVALAWDDSIGAASETGALNDNLDLVVRYCGVNRTCGDADDDIYQGNAFSEDPERDGTRNNDLLVGGRAGSGPDGWWYTLPNSFITAGGGNTASWRDLGNNSETVFVATYQNRPDENLDGTADFPALCTNADPNCKGGTARTGTWRVEVKAAAAVPTGRPFALAIAGPVTPGSTVRFSDNPIVCNGVSRVIIEEKAASAGDADPECLSPSSCSPRVISSRTIVEVFDANDVLRDTEQGLAFDAPPPGSLRFQTTSSIPVSVDSSASAADDGVLYVRGGWRVRARYRDDTGASTVVRESEAGIDCQADLQVELLRQVGRDTYFRLDGGCDDDRYLDQGEAFGLTFRFSNGEPRELPDAELELKVVDAENCPANPNDPCRSTCAPVNFIRVDNPVQAIGLLPPLTSQQSTFSLSVVGTPPTRRRLEFVLGIRSAKAGQGETSCRTFRDLAALELLAQADDEIRHFITDCQTGCTLDFDRNGDEKLEDRVTSDPSDPYDFARRGKDETAIQYLSLTTASRTPTCSNCAQNGASGGPWDFDTNREGFRSGVSQTSRLQTTDTDGCSNWGEDRNWNDVLDPGENQGGGTTGLDQNWGTGGGCGFVTGTSATQGGIWHTGTIGAYNDNGGAACRPNESICEQYDTNNGTQGQLFWFELLRTPSIHPISLGPDSTDGYEWKTQILDWSWNMQLDQNGDGYAAWSWSFDLDMANADPILLGSEFVAWSWTNGFGLVSGGQLNLLDGGPAFAPTDPSDGSPTEGDGINGAKGSNRAGFRGCWFNDLNTIDLDGGGPGTQTAAFRESANAKPEDDDCDNEFSLGPDGCPGQCGVDDDGNGQIDDRLEICPCFKCVAGGPYAGRPCFTHAQCNTGTTTSYACVSTTLPDGRPEPYGDDLCGDGSTDETLAATFGTNSSLRQTRNFSIRRIASAYYDGNIAYNMLEDFWGPVGDTWAAEIGFFVRESASSTFPAGSYGMAIDDMVIEWQELHPVAQLGSKCASSGNPAFEGQCAVINLGITTVSDADGVIPVTVIDPVATDNLVDCDGDGTLEIQVDAFSSAERTPESYCLDPVGTAAIEFAGLVRTSSRAARPGDGKVYLAYEGPGAPAVTVRYLDRNDGKNVVSSGPDGGPGVAGFDDDDDGTVDDADELCPQTTRLAPGRTPHLPGSPVRYSDDTCGCVDNPVFASVAAAFDVADLRIVNVFIRDGVGGQGTGDGDGFADPNETVVVDVAVRNSTNYPVANVKLTLQSSSPYVRDIRDNTIVVPRLEKNGGGLPGAFDTCDTRFGTSQNNEASAGNCVADDHFIFTVVGPTALSRASLDQELTSLFTVSIQGLGKAEAGSDLVTDVPVLGTAVPQTCRVVHNLDKPAVTVAPDVEETFESFARDKQYPGQSACNTGTNKCLLNYFRPFNSGDDVVELDGNRCQVSDPDNGYGNATLPSDFCQLGAGYSNTENHWHLHAPGTAGTGVCENLACPDGGRSSTALSANGRKCLSSTNLIEGDRTPFLGDGMTDDFNRMTWVEWHRAGTTSGPGNTFQLGFPDPLKTVTSPRQQAQYTGPELTFWTQLTTLDSRLFQGGGEQEPGDWTYSAARVYICVDQDWDGTGTVHPNGACDTRETGDLSGRERWEPLEAWYSPETSYRRDNEVNCMYDPSDDGSTETDFFPNSVTMGPSSTCLPHAVDTCVGRTRNDDGTGAIPVILGAGCFPETGVEAQDGVKGYAGGATWTNARWILKRYRLDAFAGRRVLFRWHIAPGEVPGVENCVSIAGPFCGNRDDGWFIDDIRVNGLAQPLALLIDNGGEAIAPPDPTICTPGTLNPALAALPYPTFDPLANRTRPAVACSDPEVATCDFDSDGVADTDTDTAATDAPLRPFQLTGITTPDAICVGGELEYRFRDGAGTILADWSAAPQTNSGALIVTPAVDTAYLLDVRCSASPSTCLQTDSIRIGCSIALNSLRLPSRTIIRWQGAGTFDSAKGDVAALRGTAGNFSGARCFENDSTDTESEDSLTPDPGASYYYLARCNGASWEDPPNTGQQGTRGATLTACP